MECLFIGWRGRGTAWLSRREGHTGGHLCCCQGSGIDGQGHKEMLGADENIVVFLKILLWIPLPKKFFFLKIMPVQKQTRAGQRTRFKAFVAIGDYNGHVGLGVKCSKEVATAIHGAIILAKLSIVRVQRGYWGNKIGKPHTVPCKVTGRCGSVLVRLIPAPRGTGIVSAPVPKKLLMMAGIDCYTSARGCTATLGNFAKATFDAISKTYSYLTPDLWKETVFTKSPYQEFTDHLVKTHTRVSLQRTQAPAVATT
ncbi:unnamed protein product [Nyctereutes procyonoides]|uniref:Small ribosomal subunit protein uS5 n=1 Tax=Nyctereutes procyonoides TaxID=34880 RepID=A0A811YWP8_NYCPR|nr:unnamed protein product [Nyctereutes procyonoides]